MKNSILFQQISKFLEGSFDNFQQAWQENTVEEIHRIEVEQKHRHLHTIIKKLADSGEQESLFSLVHFENRNKEKSVGKHELNLRYNSEKNQVTSELKNEFPSGEILFWQEEKGVISAKSENGNTKIEIINNQMLIHQKEGFFNNPTAYKMIKCRFFSGFIEIPNPDNPDTMIRMGDLKLHDQGDMVQFVYEDGKKGKFIVELTQLIFAKRLAIMKLGIYDEPLEDIHYSSKAMSYTWTNPDAKRIGINLRKMLTGWTYIEPGFVSSNNMDLDKK